MAAPKARVLVIGGTQFIGRATVSSLLRIGCDVTLVNRGKTHNPFGSRVRTITCDRRKHPDQLLAILRDTGATAWDAVVDFVAFGPKDVNPIVQAGGRCIRRYIFVSTDSVYMAVDEDNFVRGQTGALLEASDADGVAQPLRAKKDEYGADKLQAEVALRASQDLSSLALRLPDVFGPYENTERQEKLLMRILKGRRIGTQVEGRDLGHSLPLSIVAAGDVANAVSVAVAQASSHDGSSAASLPVGLCALHVCVDERPTWCGLVEGFAAALRRVGLEFAPVRFDSSRSTSFVSVDCGALDNEAAKAVLSSWAPLPLEQRLQEAVDWWVDHIYQHTPGEVSGPKANVPALSAARRKAAVAALQSDLDATTLRSGEGDGHTHKRPKAPPPDEIQIEFENMS